MRKKLVCLALLAVVVVVMLAACGSSKKKSSASSTFVFASSADPVLLDPELLTAKPAVPLEEPDNREEGDR